MLVPAFLFASVAAPWVLTACAGVTYKGEWASNQPCGTGVLRALDGRWQYTGRVADARPAGSGRMDYADGSLYLGGFEAGRRHGTGTHVLASGDIYDGQWAGDLRSGTGLLRVAGTGAVMACVYKGGVLVRASQVDASVFVMRPEIATRMGPSGAELEQMLLKGGDQPAAAVAAVAALAEAIGGKGVPDTPRTAAVLGEPILTPPGSPFGGATRIDKEAPSGVKPASRFLFDYSSSMSFLEDEEARIAAALGYLQDALEARDPAGRDGKTAAQLRAYKLHRHWAYGGTVLLLCVAMMVVCVILEPVSYKHAVLDTYQALRRPLMYGELAVLGLLLVDSLIRFFHIAFVWNEQTVRYRIEPMRFVGQTATFISTVVTLLLIADVVMALVIPVGSTAGLVNVRWARILRPLLVLCHSKALRQLMRLIGLTLPRILDLLALILIIMFVFAIVGLTLFDGLYDDSTTDAFSGTIRSVATCVSLLCFSFSVWF
jgi:hypothetical protein